MAGTRAEAAKSGRKPSRLGRGLTSLMATPVSVSPPAPPAPAPEDRVGSSAAASAGEPAAASGNRASPSSFGESDLKVADDAGLRHVPVESVRPNRHQPRQAFDQEALQGLADSIRSDGLMQPIVVRPAGEGQYELVAGERRWRAAKLVGLTELPALVRELDDQQLAEWALIENLQREDLNPIERAEAFERLGAAFGLSHDEIAGRVGLERSTVTNLLRLLRLAGPVREHVSRGTLSMGHARAIAAIEDHDAQGRLAERCLREGWSVRQVEAAVRIHQQGVEAKPRPAAPARAAHLADLERQIAEHLKTKVKIKAGRKKGAGSLTIDFYSIDQFDALLGTLGVTPE